MGDLPMRLAFAAAVAALIVSSGAGAEQFTTQSIRPVPLPPTKHEWRTEAVPTDNSLSIAFELPQAKWTAGQGIDVMTLPDSGQEPSPSGGFITGPTQVVLKHDPTFDLWTMAQAKGWFKLSVGDFARVFPVENFRKAVDPVLKACGDHW